MWSDFFQLIISALAASAAALTVHIFILNWSSMKLADITGGPISVPAYSRKMNIAAYVTAFVSTLVPATAYYFAQALIAAENMLLKALIVSAVILEVKGKIFREPVMNYIFFRARKIRQPAYAVFLTFADQWASGLALGSVIVFLMQK